MSGNFLIFGGAERGVVAAFEMSDSVDFFRPFFAAISGTGSEAGGGGAAAISLRRRSA